MRFRLLLAAFTLTVAGAFATPASAGYNLLKDVKAKGSVGIYQAPGVDGGCELHAMVRFTVPKHNPPKQKGYTVKRNTKYPVSTEGYVIDKKGNRVSVTGGPYSDDFMPRAHIKLGKDEHVISLGSFAGSDENCAEGRKDLGDQFLGTTAKLVISVPYDTRKIKKKK